MRATLVRPVAERIKATLAPWCERIEIAGGLRRDSTDVRDIDLVVLPRSRDAMAFTLALDRWPKVKGRANGMSTRRNVEGHEVDFSIVSAEKWACLMLIRTGCAEFSKSIVTHARTIDRRFEDGRLVVLSTGARVPVNDERDVFDALGLPWIEPQNRVSRVQDVLGRNFFRR